jgi:hypothetical protein
MVMKQMKHDTKSSLLKIIIRNNEKIESILYYSVTALAGLIAGALSIHFVVTSYQIWDGSHYLLMARMFHENGNIYNDVPTIYTPLGAIIYSIPYFLFSDPAFQIFHSIQQIFVWLCGVPVFMILRKITSQGKALAISLTCILIFISIYTKDVRLDAIYLFFLIFGYFILLRSSNPYKFFIAGSFFALSYLSKQYAILGTLPVVFYICGNKSVAMPVRFKNLFIIVIGGMSIILISGIYFIGFAGVPALSYLRILIPIHDYTDYGFTGIDYSGLTLLENTVRNYFYFTPLIIPYMVWQYKQNKQNKGLGYHGFFLLAATGFCITFFFGHYNAYFIPVIFFLFLFLSTGIVTNATVSKSSIRAHVLIILLIWGPPLVHGMRSYIYHVRHQEKLIAVNQYHELLAKQINSIIPSYSAAMIDGAESLGFLAKFNPANRKFLAIGFARSFKGETIQDQILKDAYLVIHKDRMARYTVLMDTRFVLVGEIDEYFIFKKIGDYFIPITSAP